MVWQALQQLPPELALKVSDSIRGLHSRAEMGRRINALCAAGRQAEVVRELARPYDEAHNPGAVAAARVKALCADTQAARHD